MYSSFRCPAAVSEGLRGQDQQGGFNNTGSFCWNIVRSTLRLWRYKEGPLAQVHSRKLPEKPGSICSVEICEALVRTGTRLLLLPDASPDIATSARYLTIAEGCLESKVQSLAL